MINATTLIFFLFGLITVGAGILLSLTRNVVYAGFLFFVVLFGVAALYVFAGAEFLAVSQVIIYVGGILVIVLFGIMLTQKIRELEPRSSIVNLVPGLAFAGLLLAGLIFMISRFKVEEMPWAQQNISETLPDDLHEIGKQTITGYLLPFELISILLLVALIGAAYISRKHFKPEKTEGP